MKSALTAYGRIGTDYVRMTLTKEGVFVRADGSNSIVPDLPTTFRTSGDMVNVMAQLGHRVNAASVPAVALPNHVWKKAMSFETIAAKFGISAELVALTIAEYADVDEIAA